MVHVSSSEQDTGHHIYQAVQSRKSVLTYLHKSEERYVLMRMSLSKDCCDTATRKMQLCNSEDLGQLQPTVSAIINLVHLDKVQIH